MWQTLTAQFSGDSLNYQWYRNGSPISGATNASYGFRVNSSYQGDQFYCVAYNAEGSVASAIATVTVIPRIYFDTGIWSSFKTSSTVTVTFREDGWIGVSSPHFDYNKFDTFVSPANDPDVPFNLSDYEVRVTAIPSNVPITSGSALTDWTTVSNGLSITFDVTAVDLERSTDVTFNFRDTKNPNVSWAGWDSSDIFMTHTANP